MTNSAWVSAAALTSADTLAANSEITGKITAITIVKGRAVAYMAKAAAFLS
jgi:hypothetical protein